MQWILVYIFSMQVCEYALRDLGKICRFGSFLRIDRCVIE